MRVHEARVSFFSLVVSGLLYLFSVSFSFPLCLSFSTLLLSCSASFPSFSISLSLLPCTTYTCIGRVCASRPQAPVSSATHKVFFHFSILSFIFFLFFSFFSTAEKRRMNNLRGRCVAALLNRCWSQLWLFSLRDQRSEYTIFRVTILA